MVSPNSDAPSVEAYKASLPEKDIDLFIGKIIRKDSDNVIVYVMSTPNKIPDRVTLYYACDQKMRPTAILENLNIIHKVKYIAPQKPENSDGNEKDKAE